MNTFIDILVSNFTVLITLVIGSFAIGLYWYQKRDYKRGIALLIRQEIRYAERQVGNSRDFSSNADNYPLSIKLLPTNSWYKNIHLFMNDFEQPQIDAISRFYAQVEYMDLVIKRISDYKISFIEQTIIDQQGKEIVKEVILSERVYLYEINNLLKMFPKNFLQGGIGQNENSLQTPSSISNPQTGPFVNLNIVRKLYANNILKDVSSKVTFIYNTPIGEKFKEISERKLFGFF